MSALPTPALSGAACAAAGKANSAMSAATNGLKDLNVSIVPHHEPVRLRQRRPAADTNITPNQARLDAVLEVADLGARQHDRVLQLGRADAHVLADRRVGADVGVDDLGARADHGRPAHRRALEA